MKRSLIDPGFLSVFRMFVAFRLVFSTITVLLALTVGARAMRFERTPVTAVIEAGFLLAYLSIPWLADRLGRAYLPIALGVATIGPILENYFLFDRQLSEEVSQIRAVAGQWQLSILLLVPIILMSWQYRYRIVAGYTVFLSLLDGALTFLVIGSSLGRPGPGITVAVFRMLIFLLIALIVSRLSTGERERNARLAEANRRLAASANTLEQLTISRERNRMARELHDTLAHSLSAVAVQLEAVEALWEKDPGQAHSMLDHSLVLTRNGLNEARRAIQALRTAPLEDLGLSLAIRNLATSEAERGGFQLDLCLPDEMPRLSPDLDHSLYRIAEEALRNITRHAAAQHVQVLLDARDHDLVMLIQDDGCGFTGETDLELNHYGLKGMQERAEMIGAQLVVESRPGAGTRIRLQLEQGA
jgi:signal transduction histidine kinase